MRRLIGLCGFLLLVTPGGAGADDSPLKVVEMIVCQKVADRACQAPSRAFSSEIEEVSCLSKVEGATGEAFVWHVWYFEGKETRRVKLPIKNAIYRTWSSKRIKDLPGRWKVEVLDPLDRSIGVAEFIVEPPKGAP